MQEKPPNRYTADSIRVKSGPERIYDRPKMYWGTERPTESDSVFILLQQMEILKIIDWKAEQIKNWYFVGAKTDWIASGLSSEISVSSLFERGRGFPEAGVAGSIRSEFLVYTMAVDLALWRNDELTLIKGQCPSTQARHLELNYRGMVTIAFRGNLYAQN